MNIPSDIKSYIYDVFKTTNEEVSEKLSLIPHTKEPALDELFLSSLRQYAIPKKFDSNWSLRIDAVFIGGGGHYYPWEIADIAIIIFFRNRGKLLKTKVSLLQSKRLYPNELRKSKKDDFRFYGLQELAELENDFAQSLQTRTFNFKDASKYKAIKVKDRQWESINDYAIKTGIPVYYMFYNPNEIPLKVNVPFIESVKQLKNEIGVRIVPGDKMYQTFNRKNSAPSYEEIKTKIKLSDSKNQHIAGWRLEYFVNELLLECKEGYIAKSLKDEALNNLFYRRTGPLHSAILINIETNEND